MNLQIDTHFPTLNKFTVDKTKSVFEIFKSCFESIDEGELKSIMINKKITAKDAEVSQKQRQYGNDFFKNHNYKEALNYYYLSLQNAPFESIDYVMALAERSKAHCALKNYKEALIDIERVLNYPQYPEELLCKIYIRQSQCFLHFKNYYHTLDSCNKAHKYLQLIKDIIEPKQYELRKEFIKNIIDKIDEKSNAEDLVNIEEPCWPKPQLKDGENPKFMGASNAVELKFNERKGRHVIAKTNLKPGDILFVEEPYTAVRNDDFLFSMRYCSHCLKYCETSLPCNRCIIHFYCSEHCRQVAWIKEHRWICYGEMNELLGDAMRLTLNTIFKASLNNFNTEASDLSYYGSNVDNFPYIYQLTTNKTKLNIKEISEFTKLSIWMVIYLKECTDFFLCLHKLPAFAKCQMKDLYNLVGGHILQLSMQVHCNSDEIINTKVDLETQQLKKDNIGFGLYISSAMINHSCQPNSKSVFEGNLKIVRAVKKIPKNTEITIDYLCFYIGIENIDKNFFRDNYKFTCTCPKCSCPLKDEKKPWLCSKCQGKAFNITESQAKCINCRIIFNIKGYKNIEENIDTMIQSPTISAIDNINKKMKKIYHKDNIRFACYLNLFFEFHKDEANIPKIVGICKDLVQLSDKYNDVDELKLHAYLKLLRATGMRYFFMNLELLPHDDTFYQEFQEIKEKGYEMLNFFVPRQQIKEYRKYIHDYFDPKETY